MGLQVTYMSENKLQKEYFWAKQDYDIMPFLKPCYNLYMRIYATSKELKKKAFPVKCQNMKQPVSMEVTFILVNKHQKNSHNIMTRTLDIVRTLWVMTSR